MGDITISSVYAVVDSFRMACCSTICVFGFLIDLTFSVKINQHMGYLDSEMSTIEDATSSILCTYVLMGT